MRTTETLLVYNPFSLLPLTARRQRLRQYSSAPPYEATIAKPLASPLPFERQRDNQSYTDRHTDTAGHPIRRLLFSAVSSMAHRSIHADIATTTSSARPRGGTTIRPDGPGLLQV